MEVEKKPYHLAPDYIIYSDGRCYSQKSDKFLTPQLSTTYPTYNLTIEGKKKKTKVHRMVAETFLPLLEGKTVVNHIDGNTHNFDVSNLEWVSRAENSQHAVTTGLTTPKNNKSGEEYSVNFDSEVWVPLSEFVNYDISNYGRIRNKNTLKLKKTPLDNNGYPHTNLWKDGKGKTFQVHRLEYAAFFPEEDLDGYVINHIDGNKENNMLSNLEKVTYQENNKHAEYIIQTHSCSTKVIMLDKDGNELKEFPSIAEAQRITGFSCISRAISKGYSTQGYYWKKK